MNRREFIKAAALAPAAMAASPTFDADFGTAMAAADAIRKKRISSLELTTHCFDRIAKYNPQLNAVILQFKDQALDRARKADAALGREGKLGPSHGVPVTVKESFHIAGVPTTWGIKPMAEFKPKHNSALVERLDRAGAIIVGKTNVPVMLSDWQSYNPIYGTTNNPWDLKRSPGGSTGGGAAALAAGLGFLTIGSDIGGSIRVPAHFCGLYGHKPTIDLVSMRGHTPPPVDADIHESHDLPVAGPLARSAADLREALVAIGGQDGDEAVAWKWTLPEPRHARLKDFRIGCMLDDAFCPVSSEEAPVFQAVLSALGKAGARAERGWPEGLDPAASLETYLFMLGADLFSRLPKAQLDPMRVNWEKNPQDPMLSGAFAPHSKWLEHLGNQSWIRSVWRRYFRSHDVFLMPVAFVPAFPHDQSEPLESRLIATPEGKRPYMDMIKWVSFATLAGIPATVAPVGKTAAALPVGLQILGPMWEDATPIEFAARLTEAIGGFERPKGY